MPSEPESFDDWLERQLRCPYDGAPLTPRSGREGLCCHAGHEFPVVQGIPVLLRTDVASTHPRWWTTPQQIAIRSIADRPRPPGGELDPFVRRFSVATCGLLYRGMRDPLPRYPIASLEDLPEGNGRTLLDVGGNWGRWALGAARRGYRTVVADPSLEAAIVGRRIAAELGLDVRYVVADGRHLPFADGAFAVNFSYSVLQSLSKADALQVLTEMARVTELDGTVRVQMANVLGLRRFTKALAEVAEDLVKKGRDPAYAPWAFRVRAWTPREIKRRFDEIVGPTTLSIDGFFTLNAQAGDADLLKRRYAAVIHASRALVRVSRLLPGLLYFADSLYAQATKTRGGGRVQAPAPSSRS